MFKRRYIILISSLLAVLLLAVGAYAYWTTTGAGTGSATNASANGTLVLHATFASTLTPGATLPVSFTADNASTSSLRVGTVTTVVSIDAPHVTSGCLAGDFTVGPAIENQTIAKATSGVALLVPGSIVFNDTALNQDGCKGATVTLTLSA